jgi:hypothetical protein
MLCIINTWQIYCKSCKQVYPSSGGHDFTELVVAVEDQQGGKVAESYKNA